MVQVCHSKRIATMHEKYGVDTEHRCGTCGHYQQKNMYCQLASTKSPNWAASWIACGRWQERDRGD